MLSTVDWKWAVSNFDYLNIFVIDRSHDLPFHVRRSSELNCKVLWCVENIASKYICLHIAQLLNEMVALIPA